jgi:hypothetical protein
VGYSPRRLRVNKIGASGKIRANASRLKKQGYIKQNIVIDFRKQKEPLNIFNFSGDRIPRLW